MPVAADDLPVARAYQEELAVRALSQNAILAMDTGTGKTLISVMVLRSKLVAARIKVAQDHRMVAIFIVPHVPLVSQQANFIRQTTQLVVGEYHGAKGVDLWSREQWEKEFASTDVLVMTAQVFKDVLAHAHWKLENVAIIVFDEIHHCSKKHPYARIMREHYSIMKDTDRRPHVIGLTASPIFNVKNPLKALTEIEQLSACRVFVVKDNKEELKKFTFQAKPIHCNYEPSPRSFPMYPGPSASPGLSLWDHLHSDGLLPTRLLGNDKWYRGTCSRYRSTVDALGPFAADLFIYLHIDNILTDLLHQLPNSLFADNDSPEITKKRAKVAKFRHILQAHHARLFSDDPMTTISRDWVSPKVLRLRELLAKEDASTFRGMIFVGQRHFASCLSVILPRLDLPNFAPAPLVGHGEGVTSNVTRLGSKGMGFNTQERVVQQFRDGELNLIIATSVGEEGLDFPQCSFVCRFDMPHTLPAYIQSRGRARHSDSKFVLMLEAGENLDRVRAIALEKSEPSMKHLYGRKMEKRDKGELPDDPDDGVPAEKEQSFTVKKTGATLHASSAISLLNNLCSLIPRDAHTPIPLPRYEMAPNLFLYKVTLPACLPVPRDKLEFRGQVGTSKKGAKRSAAYEAVLALYELGVFDDHFLPVNRNRGSVTDDIDGKPPVDVDHLQPMMEAPVFDIWGDVWRDQATAYIHPLEVEGQIEMALVLGNSLDGRAGTIWESNRPVSFRMGAGIAMVHSGQAKTRALDTMERYTKHNLSHTVTRKGKGKSRVFLVPFDVARGQPDYAEMERILSTPYTLDWDMAGISELDDVYAQLLVDCRPVKVLGVQSNMSAAEALTETKLAKKFASIQRLRPGIEVPENDPVLRCRRVLFTTSSEYRDPILQKQSLLGTEDLFWPHSLCERLNITTRTLDYFKLLPPLTRHLSDIFRGRAAMVILGLPPLNLERAAEALMLPSSNASFSNQRLETLGDSFLKLATTIHAFNKFPYKHEGQLSCLRQNSLCNKYLMGRGHALELMRFMTVEPNNHRTWRLNVEQTVVDEHGLSYVKRYIPRRSIQDCMEALLGAAFLSGGVQCGLSVGTKIGLCFGGTDAWSTRYAKVEPTPRANICAALEDALGYHFKDQNLVMEAINHPTSGTGGATYQRLEFLGDALIDLVVLHYLFEKYPSASPGKLTRLRARCVCNPTLASAGTKKLGLHKTIETTSLQLVKAMKEAADTFDSMSYVEVVDSMWRLDVPKALSDVVEALLGAVLIDSSYDYELTREVVLRLLKEALEYVHPQLPDDPIHEFLKWVGKFGCGQVRFRKASSPGEEDPDAPKNLIYVVVHGIDIEPPVPIAYKTSIVGTRAEAAHKAHLLLQDELGPYALSKICTCKVEETKKFEEAADGIVDEDALDPETVEGFATAAQLEYRAEREGDLRLKVMLERQLDAEEEAEVEELILEQEEDAGGDVDGDADMKDG